VKTEKVEKTFKVWKTIRLGDNQCKSPLAFRNALVNVGCDIGDGANNMLGELVKISPKERNINLVNVSVEELGFKGVALLDQIYDKAFELGLLLCPFEVGLELRLQYADQPNRECLNIAMNPVPGSQALNIFVVEHDGNKCWLTTGCGETDYYWNGDDRFIFCLPTVSNWV